jgi:hypothetical protein
MNWEAQLECGIGSDPTNKTWGDLVDSSFNITYWPYIQAGNNSDCLQQVMQQSLLNLQKLNSMQGISSMFGAFLISLVALYVY